MNISFLIIPLSFALLLSCNPKKPHTSGNDSTNTDRTDTAVAISASPAIEADSSLLAVSDTILQLMRKQDLLNLTSFIHPRAGIRFSPYGTVDTMKDQRLSSKQFADLITNKKAINWGTSAGTGEPITSNLRDYFKKFVYDADFVNAERKSINKIVGRDSSSVNVALVYPNSQYVQYYFSSLNKKYEGMDWKSLVLVFSRINARYFLIGIVHDQWKG